MSVFDPPPPGLESVRPSHKPDPEPSISSSMAAVPTTPPVIAPTTAAPTSRATTAPVVPTTSAPVPTTAAPTTTAAATTVPPVSSAVTTTVPPVVSSSLVVSSSVVSSAASISSAAATTSSAAPTTSSPSSAASTTASPTTSTIFQTVSRPSLVTNVSASSRSSAAAASATSEGKGGVGGSGLSIGALVGIIIGGIAAIALIAFLVTHSMRKKARSRRTANRSSMFEPWPAPAPVALEDEPYEKSRFDAPSQSYPMQNQSYDPYTNAQQQAYHNESQPLAGYPAAGQPGYPGGPGPDPSYNYAPEYGVGGDYPPQGYPPAHSGAEYAAGGGYGGAGVGAGMAAAAVGVGAGATSHDGHPMINPVTGLADGMMVRVKVGFVRTLEDELAITPDQQLYLHNQYDDGWSLCEDQNQNRGVVPVSCLVAWTEQPSGDHLAPGSGMPRSNTAESLTGGTRRSSLYNAQAQGAQRMSQHGAY